LILAILLVVTQPDGGIMDLNPAEQRPECSLPSTELLTFAEAAAYLRISTRTLMRYVHDRKLEAFSLAGTTTRRVRRGDVARLLVPLAGSEPEEIQAFIRSRTRVA
jgi:excisionase family DNA binding protein